MMSAGAPSTLSLVAKSSSDDPAPCFRNGSKFSYTLDFLLSIGKSDRCQRLPCDLDSTVLWDSGLNEEPQQIPPPPLPFFSHSSKWDSSKWDSSKWDSNYVRSPLKSNPQSGILGKGALLRTPCLPTFSTVPKTEETTSCHLLARSVAPYRPPHLYKPNLQPEIDDAGGKAFGTSEVNGAVKTEEERQKKASELLWKEQPAILDTEMNASAVPKENLDPSNRTCTADFFKKYSTPVQESGNPEQIKNYDLKVDQTTKLSSPEILPWFKEGTEGKPTDQNTELNKQQLTNTRDGSNDGIREVVKSSTYLSAAEEVFKQLREWDKSTKEREESSGISHDAGSHNLLHLLEESTCVESLVAAFCICEEEEEEEEEEETDSSEDTATRLCSPEECQSTFDLPAEADEPPLDINLRGAISTSSEMRLEISTEEGPPVIPVANASDEICWPDEDALITVKDFMCPKAVNGVYTEVGLQDSPRPVDFRECDKTSNPTAVRNAEKKTPPTTPASKTTKSNSIVKKHSPPRVFPPYPSVPRFNNAIRTPAPLPPTPPSLFGMPPLFPFPGNQTAPYSQFGLPPPFPFPHQMYGNLSAKRDLSAGDLGILNNMPFEEGKQLGGGHLGWPWFGYNA